MSTMKDKIGERSPPRGLHLNETQMAIIKSGAINRQDMWQIPKLVILRLEEEEIVFNKRQVITQSLPCSEARFEAMMIHIQQLFIISLKTQVDIISNFGFESKLEQALIQILNEPISQSPFVIKDFKNKSYGYIYCDLTILPYEIFENFHPIFQQLASYITLYLEVGKRRQGCVLQYSRIGSRQFINNRQMHNQQRHPRFEILQGNQGVEGEPPHALQLRDDEDQESPNFNANNRGQRNDNRKNSSNWIGGRGPVPSDSLSFSKAAPSNPIIGAENQQYFGAATNNAGQKAKHQSNYQEDKAPDTSYFTTGQNNLVVDDYGQSYMNNEEKALISQYNSLTIPDETNQVGVSLKQQLVEQYNAGSVANLQQPEHIENEKSESFDARMKNNNGRYQMSKFSQQYKESKQVSGHKSIENGTRSQNQAFMNVLGSYKAISRQTPMESQLSAASVRQINENNFRSGVTHDGGFLGRDQMFSPIGFQNPLLMDKGKAISNKHGKYIMPEGDFLSVITPSDIAIPGSNMVREQFEAEQDDEDAISFDKQPDESFHLGIGGETPVTSENGQPKRFFQRQQQNSQKERLSINKRHQMGGNNLTIQNAQGNPRTSSFGVNNKLDHMNNKNQSPVGQVPYKDNRSIEGYGGRGEPISAHASGSSQAAGFLNVSRIGPAKQQQLGPSRHFDTEQQITNGSAIPTFGVGKLKLTQSPNFTNYSEYEQEDHMKVKGYSDYHIQQEGRNFQRLVESEKKTVSDNDDPRIDNIFQQQDSTPPTIDMWAVKSKSESNPFQFNNPAPSPGNNLQIRSVNINLTNNAVNSPSNKPTPKAGILKNANQLHYSNQAPSGVSGSFNKNSGISGISNNDTANNGQLIQQQTKFYPTKRKITMSFDMANGVDKKKTLKKGQTKRFMIGDEEINHTVGLNTSYFESEEDLYEDNAAQDDFQDINNEDRDHNPSRKTEEKMHRKKTATFEKSRTRREKDETPEQSLDELLSIIWRRHLRKKFCPSRQFVKKVKRGRKSIKHMIKSRMYIGFILCVVLLNSICLAFYDYSHRDSEKPLENRIVTGINHFFTIIFLIEAVLKTIVFGLYFPNSKKENSVAYLKDPWNYIDLAIIISGMIELFNGTNTYEWVRQLRVIRPLKSIVLIPNLKSLLVNLVLTLPDFANVGLFLGFIFLLFATMGLHLYNGSQYNQCRTTPAPLPGATSWELAGIDRVCSNNGLGYYRCPEGTYCGNPEKYPEIDLSTEKLETRYSISFDITNFNNLATSLLSVYQMIMSETWQFQLYILNDYDYPLIGAIYSFLVIIVGQFFLLNLILAVIIEAFILIQKRDSEIRFHEVEKIEDPTVPRKPTEEEQIEPLKKMIIALTQNFDKHKDPEEVIPEKVLPKIEEEPAEQNVSKGEEPIKEIQTKPKQQQEENQFKEESDESIFLHHTISKMTTRSKNRFVRKKQKEKIDKLKRYLSHYGNDKILEEELEDDDSEDERPARRNPFSTSAKKPTPTEDNQVVVWNGKEYNLSGDRMKTVLKSQVQRKKLVNILKMGWAALGKMGDGQNQTVNEDGAVSNFTMSKGPFNQTAGEVSDFNRTGVDSNFNQTANFNVTGKAEDDANDSNRQLTTKNVGVSNQDMMQKISLMLKNKLDSNFQTHLEQIVYLARLEYQKHKEDPQMRGHTLRQLVGLKFCLEMLKRIKISRNDTELMAAIYKRNQEKWVYQKCFFLSQSSFFATFMHLTVLLNIVAISFDSYPLNQGVSLILLEYINAGFSAIYILELLIRLCGLGFKSYVKIKFNIFDAILASLCVVDVILSALFLWDHKDRLLVSPLMSILKFTRIIRVFKLQRYWMRFQIILETLSQTIIDVRWFSILIGIFIYMYTILGLDFFSHLAKFDEKNQVDTHHGHSPMFNFDDLLNSFFTVFIIMTNDGQSVIFNNFYRAVSGPLATAYWLTLVMFGQKILLNLFLAFLLQNFDEGTMRDRITKIQEVENQIGRLDSRIGLWDQTQACLRTNIDLIIARIMSYDSFQRHLNAVNEQKKRQDKVMHSFHAEMLKATQSMFRPAATINQSDSTIDQKSFNPDQPILFGHSMGILSEENLLRRALFYISNSRLFQYIIVLAIIFSSVQLALDGPLVDPYSTTQKILDTIDVATTIVFVVEAGLKLIIFGIFFNGPWSYFRNAWNIIDFIIVIFSLLSMENNAGENDLSFIKMLRIFRALRFISKNDGLKVAVGALLQSIPNILNVTIMMILVNLIFAAVLVSYFKGQQYYCTYKDHHNVHTKWDCHNYGGEWANKIYTFDDMPHALVNLFVMSTTVGWAENVVSTIGSTGIDHAINEDQRPAFWIFFFIIFMCVGCFFFLNFFVGVVVSNFYTEHDKVGGNNLLTDKQKEWIELKLLVLRSQPLQRIKAPNNWFMKIFYNIYEKKWFHNTILVCIVLNTVILMINWYRQPTLLYAVNEQLNYIFTVVFCLEAIIKIFAIGARKYFKDGWNTFDFIILLGSFIGIFVSSITNVKIKVTASVFRAFRILRIMRLIKRAGKGLNLIFNTFLITLHSLVNIGGLLLVFIFMYSILGMMIFGYVKRNGIMNDYINFENFTNSFMTLFVVATNDTWHLIMAAFALDNTLYNQCIPNPTYEDYLNNGSQTNGCGSRLKSSIFFVSYMFVLNLVFLKLFIAIILHGYTDTQIQDQRLFNEDMNDRFREVWAEYDPDGTSFIRISDFRTFLFALGEPLGFDSSYMGEKHLQDQFIATLELPTYDDFSTYQYMDIIDALSFRIMVLDHMKKNELTKQATFADPSPGNQNVQEVENNTKAKLSKEINKLIFNKRSENISAVKEVWEKEIKKIKAKEKLKDKEGLTSTHHIAAEIAVRRMKAFLDRTRKINYRAEIIKERKKNKIGKMTVVKFNRNESNMFGDHAMSDDSDSRWNQAPQSVMQRVGSASDNDMGHSGRHIASSGIRALNSGFGTIRFAQDKRGTFNSGLRNSIQDDDKSPPSQSLGRSKVSVVEARRTSLLLPQTTAFGASAQNQNTLQIQAATRLAANANRQGMLSQFGKDKQRKRSVFVPQGQALQVVQQKIKREQTQISRLIPGVGQFQAFRKDRQQNVTSQIDATSIKNKLFMNQQQQRKPTAPVPENSRKLTMFRVSQSGQGVIDVESILMSIQEEERKKKLGQIQSTSSSGTSSSSSKSSSEDEESKQSRASASVSKQSKTSKQPSPDPPEQYKASQLPSNREVFSTGQNLNRAVDVANIQIDLEMLQNYALRAKLTQENAPIVPVGQSGMLNQLRGLTTTNPNDHSPRLKTPATLSQIESEQPPVGQENVNITEGYQQLGDNSQLFSYMMPQIVMTTEPDANMAAAEQAEANAPDTQRGGNNKGNMFVGQ